MQAAGPCANRATITTTCNQSPLLLNVLMSLNIINDLWQEGTAHAGGALPVATVLGAGGFWGPFSGFVVALPLRRRSWRCHEAVCGAGAGAFMPFRNGRHARLDVLGPLRCQLGRLLHSQKISINVRSHQATQSQNARVPPRPGLSDCVDVVGSLQLDA